MVITIFFIIAGFLILIGSLIYVRSKNNLIQIKPTDKQNNKKSKKDLITIWNIDSISNEIITYNGKHSIIIELGSIDYNLLNDDEQLQIDKALSNLSKTFKYSTQFFSTTQKLDMGYVIENIDNNVGSNKNEKIKIYGKKIIKHLEYITNEKNLYVRKNYLIISSYGMIDKIEKKLKDYYKSLKYNLLSIKVNAKLLDDIEIIELLHRELNKNGELEYLLDIVKRNF